MKKILFTLFLLLTTMAAWAEGTGDGTKEHPYSGEWKDTEVMSSLFEIGEHYLAYDFTLVGEGSVTTSVIDDKLDTQVATDLSVWHVGDDLIGDNPNEAYIQYCSFNPDRKNHIFIVTDATAHGNIIITGHFSGTYPQYDGYIPVTTAAELQSVIRNDIAAKVLLCADIDVSGIGKIRDNFKGTISGIYSKVDPETNKTVTAYHILKGRNTKEHDGDRLQLHLFDNVDGATFENIVFSNFMVHADDDNLGIIAQTAKNSKFKNLIFNSCSMFNNDDYVGVVAGTASNCSFEIVMMQGCDVTTDGEYAGAIVGKSDHCQFNRVMCGTGVYVFADGNVSNAWSGGITGYSENDNFTHCIHMGLVGANSDYVGGMAGSSKDSNFLSCSNAAMVAHCQGEKFSEIQEQREEELKKLDETTLKTMFSNIYVGGATTIVGTGVFGIVSYLTYIAEAEEFLQGYSMWGGMEGVTLEFLGGAPEASPFIGYILPAIMLGLTIWYVYYDGTGDCYAGGIVGLAENGTIEQCANYGLVNSIKSFVGGIVGDAVGVVINNCLNGGTVHQDRDNHWFDGPYRVGGIVGRGRENTKVTNCLTANGYPISGSRTKSDIRLDQASGNNFSIGRTDHDSELDFLELSVSQEIVKNGLVAFWLNNGTENVEKGIRPWHQNLWARQIDGQEVKRDDFPILDAAHDEVTADLFYDDHNRDSEHFYYINDANGLQAFADAVNKDNKEFAIGFLESDIDFEGKTWNPIGMCADHKRFRGFFDGRGHTIKGIVSETDRDDTGSGLFGTVDALAYICNVTVDATSYLTNAGMGGAAGIVGNLHSGSKWGNLFIVNCGSNAHVIVNEHGGGIIGRIWAPSAGDEHVRVYINNCYSTGDVTATNGNSGLLCGYAQNYAHVSDCWSSGNLLSKTDGKKPYDDSHGEYFVGYHEKVNIKDCYTLDPTIHVQNASSDLKQNGVEVFDAGYLNNGLFTLMLNGNTNDVTQSLSWQQNLGTDASPVPGPKGVYHAREISNQYGTVCLPYALKSDDTISYYTFQESTDDNGEVKLHFDYVETVAPFTPVLFKAAETGEITICDTNNGWADSPVPPTPGDWMLIGLDEEKVYTGETAKIVYYVSDGQIKNAQKVTIKPYRAHFMGPNFDDLTNNGTSSARISIVLDGEEDETTALEFVGNDLHPAQNAKSYTLFGTEAGEGYSGIVIRGGKKVAVNM